MSREVSVARPPRPALEGISIRPRV